MMELQVDDQVEKYTGDCQLSKAPAGEGGTMTARTASIAAAVYGRYYEAYGRDMQGVCPLIADEILAEVGHGEAVAGYLTWYGGSCRRAHWWTVIDGEIVDPMGDSFLATEEAPGRAEEYRALRVAGYAVDHAIGWAV